LGSKPNLKQMHAAARAGVSDSLVDVVLEKTIQDAAKLTDGARAAGAKVHKLPAKPADIDDDGLFHYAVLGPAAACDAGKPSAHARRFLDETTGPDKPRAPLAATDLLPEQLPAAWNGDIATAEHRRP